MDENARFSIIAVVPRHWRQYGVHGRRSVLLLPLGSCRSCSHRLGPMGRPMRAAGSLSCRSDVKDNGLGARRSRR